MFLSSNIIYADGGASNVGWMDEKGNVYIHGSGLTFYGGNSQTQRNLISYFDDSVYKLSLNLHKA